MNKILVLGATSAIAQEVARCFAGDGDDFFLVGRSEAKLKAVQLDLLTRGAGMAEIMACDLLQVEAHSGVIDSALAALGGHIDVALLAYGAYGDQEAPKRSFADAKLLLDSNLVSQVSLMTLIAGRMEAVRRGAIIVISSVAGDRGRQSNYVYGAAKAGLSAYVSGLRNRLHASNVAVMTVKPGFVDTPMTAAIPKGPLFASPQSVGRAIYRAFQRGSNVAYVPWFWLPIMTIIKLIPEGIFKRLKL